MHERPEKSSQSMRGATVALVAMIVLMPLLYLLSIGPAVWLFKNGAFSVGTMESIIMPVYAPLDWVRGHFPLCGAVMDSYVELWVPDFFAVTHVPQ
jgi:hypothetical protein